MKSFVFTAILFLLALCILLVLKPSPPDRLTEKEDKAKQLEDLFRTAEKIVKIDPKKSLMLSQEAYLLAKKQGLQETVNRATFLLSEGYLNIKRIDSAMYFAELSIEGFKNAGNYNGYIKAMNQRGLVYLTAEKYSEAEEIFSKTFEESRTILKKDTDNEDLRELSTHIFNNLTLVFIGRGSYLEAKNRLLELGQRQGYESSFSGMLVEGNLSTAYYMLGQYDSALIRADKALEIAIDIDDQSNRLKIIMDKGNIYYAAGRISESLNTYNKALDELKDLNLPVKMATIYNNMAVVYRSQSNYEKATEYFLEAIKVKISLNDTSGLALNYNNLAVSFMDYGNFKSAFLYFRKAERINILKNNKKSLSANYNGLADLYMEMGIADSTIYYYQKSLEIKQSIGYKKGIILSLSGLGKAYSLLLKNNQKALEYYNDALRLAMESGSEYNIAELNTSIGELNFEKNNLHAAYKHLNDGIMYANRENAWELIHRCSRLLTLMAIKRGETVAAAESFSLFRDASDTLFNQGKTKAVIELQTKYESEKREQENQILMIDAAAKRKQIHHLIWISAIITALSIIIIFLYRQKVIALNQIVLRNLEIVKSEKLIEFDRQSVIKASAENSHPDVPDAEDLTKNLIARLEKFMMEEKPYLIPGLSLEDVCRKLNTNRSYLSQIINDHYKQNFNTYINDQRIREARRLFSSDKFDHISVEGVGSMVGFSNKVTFHTHFKNFAGVTPAFFRTVAKKYV